MTISYGFIIKNYKLIFHFKLEAKNTEHRFFVSCYVLSQLSLLLTIYHKHNFFWYYVHYLLVAKLAI